MSTLTAATLAQQTATHAQRITSIDALRGFVMVVMLLDHVRETFFLHLQVSDPMAVPGTPPALFFSRLAAHLCAPVFVFLTGLSAWLYAHPPQGAPRDANGFLLKRGLFLIALELTLVNLAWSGRYEVLYLQVMWAIGLSMLALAALIALPRSVLLALGVLIVAGHNALAGVQVAPDSPGHGLWTVLLQRGWLVDEGIVRVRLSYPVLPWIGVMLLGWCFAPVFAVTVSATRRRALLLATGAACLALVVLLRGLNLYGENAPWQPGATALQTAMSWLNFTKYPPSLDFVLLTLGAGLLLLAALERADNAFTRVCTTFGGAPMFFYVLHLYVLLAGYHAALWWWGPNQGTRFGVDADQFWLIWVIWLAMLPLLYVPVRAFGRFKRRSTQAWVKYC